MNDRPAKTPETLLVAPGDIHELVRGQENGLLERIAPLTSEHNILLDLADVDRIDAAGIAALISLYVCAMNAGHQLTVVNAAPRIAEIIGLVGLDRVLFSRDEVPAAPPETCCAQSAA